MSNLQTLYIGNDSLLDVASLRNEANGDYLDAASVSVQLFDQDQVPVAGADWPMALAYVAGSRGLYRVTLPYSLSLSDGARYTARIVADAGPGLRAQWDMACVARARA